MSPSERLAAIKAQTPEELEEKEIRLLREMAHRYGEQWRSAEAERRERQEAAKERRRESSAAAPKDPAAVRRRKAARRRGA